MTPSFGQRDPDARGYYGAYGGRFVPETLVAPVAGARGAPTSRPAQDEAFLERARATCCATTSDAPTPLYEARRLSAVARRRAHLPQARGSRAHRRAQDQQRARPGAARQADGQAARHRRDRRGAARRRHAPRSARCSGCECDVYMGAEDMERQSLNVFRMQLLGATVRRVDAGAGRSRTRSTRRCATGSTNVADSYYLLGSVLGPHPYPLMVREFQSVIGQEARAPVPRRDRPAARHDRRLRRRRQQRHGHLRRVHRRSERCG